ncbi:hypothetical protein [Nocardia niwae]|uniref:Uncharacterized protein n=1 Tax=Nocardia niwae TaxID=626084 RepID=A0ABV2X852_9NOCA|nr:hypothetical protein [Nocardia niwae]
MVEVDPVLGHAETEQGHALGGEVLFVGGAPRIADEYAHLNISVAVSAPVRYIITVRLK